MKKTYTKQLMMDREEERRGDNYNSQGKQKPQIGPIHT